MAAHQAAEQMLGYLYQVRSALLLLLRNDDVHTQISIERFDDVAFMEDDTPVALIQNKHHIRRRGNLTDASTDLWRTINAWCDTIFQTPSIVENSRFLILTTALAPAGSACSF
jgi:hypothetical protein